jgi:ankyrin repeat protein
MKAGDDLFHCAKWNYAAGVRQALQNGAYVNCIRSRRESTPLMEACYEGHDSIVRILLKAGADVRCRDWECESAFEMACAMGHTAIVKRLLNHDEGLLEIEGSRDRTPLLVAIQNQRFEIVRFLLNRGANALATTEDGSTTLNYA